MAGWRAVAGGRCESSGFVNDAMLQGHHESRYHRTMPATAEKPLSRSRSALRESQLPSCATEDPAAGSAPPILTSAR